MPPRTLRGFSVDLNGTSDSGVKKEVVSSPLLWGKVAPGPDRHIEGRLWADHRRVADPPGAE